jgi:hypothetical protein
MHKFLDNNFFYQDIARVPQQFKVSKEEQTRITTARNEEEQIKILKEISKDMPLLNCTYRYS